MHQAKPRGDVNVRLAGENTTRELVKGQRMVIAAPLSP